MIHILVGFEALQQWIPKANGEEVQELIQTGAVPDSKRSYTGLRLPPTP